MRVYSAGDYLSQCGFTQHLCACAEEAALLLEFYFLTNSGLWLIYDVASGACTMPLPHGFIFISIVTAMARVDYREQIYNWLAGFRQK